MRFDSTVLGLADGTTLEGYWQSERYFIDQAALVRREFAVRTEPNGDNRRMLQEIDACVAVSIHVRRGDYVSNPQANAVHGTCDLPYYERAMQFVLERAGTGVRFFVFSDDPEWVAANLRCAAPTTYVRHNGADRNFEDLRLMSRCHHHIIANSSFSWWGAWLNGSADKIVVAPQRWFRADELDASDIVPPGWTRL